MIERRDKCNMAVTILVGAQAGNVLRMRGRPPRFAANCSAPHCREHHSASTWPNRRDWSGSPSARARGPTMRVLRVARALPLRKRNGLHEDAISASNSCLYGSRRAGLRQPRQIRCLNRSHHV